MLPFALKTGYTIDVGHAVWRHFLLVTRLKCTGRWPFFSFWKSHQYQKNCRHHKAFNLTLSPTWKFTENDHKILKLWKAQTYSGQVFSLGFIRETVLNISFPTLVRRSIRKIFCLFLPFCISPHLAIQWSFHANGGASEFEKTKTVSDVLDKQT